MSVSVSSRPQADVSHIPPAQRRAIRRAITALLERRQPPPGLDYGLYDSLVLSLAYTLAHDGPEAMLRQYQILYRSTPSLAALIDAPEADVAPEEATPAPGRVGAFGLSTCPPLPAGVALPAEMGYGASDWLNAYLDYSRRWSPLAFDDFHEAVALWLLSTVAARRVVIPFGGTQATPLYIALVARTSLYAKSTTARLAKRTLAAAGLDWLLLPDESTPQKMLQEMAGSRLPEDYEQFSEEQRERLRRRLALSGQRGWFYDEFGQKLALMQREEGPLAEFRGILRRLNDCDDSYEYGTIGRGTDRIEQPYLALLASLTPADLRHLGRRGAALWGDGTWARFAFVTPPEGQERSRARFPTEDDTIPQTLWGPLVQWHRRLGLPVVEINPIKDGRGEPSGRYRIERGSLPQHRCTLEAGVLDAYYAYLFALQDLTAAHPEMHDLDGNYSRLPEKALRIAALLASLEHEGHLQRRHWARAQAITERWRASLHALVDQLGERAPSQAAQHEERILHLVEQRGQVTIRELRQFLHLVDSGQLRATLESLTRAGILEAIPTQQTVRYRLAAQEEVGAEEKCEAAAR
jgi:hypothetical protein